MTLTASPMVPAGAVAVLWTAAFCLSCALSVVLHSPLTGVAPSAEALLLRGGGEALASTFYGTADLYFHRGVPHTQPRLLGHHPLARLADEVAPRQHAHTTGSDVREMLPWLWLAIRANPHEPEFYLVASFWIASEIGRPDLALQVLASAQQNIPYCHEAQFEMARIHIEAQRLPEAAGCLDAGLAFWRHRAALGREPDPLPMGSMLLYRALVHESLGERLPAAAALRELAGRFPDRPEVRDRIRDLESGRAPAMAGETLRRLAEQEDRRRSTHTCPVREADGTDGRPAHAGHGH